MARTNVAERILIIAVLFLSLFLTSAPVFAQTQARESDVARLFTQAEAYIKKGDYELAIGCYNEAAALSQGRMNLSQSYFGLALCHYHLRDRANAAKFIRKVLEVDPNKEISELFYPVDFVRLFAQVRSEIAAAPKTETEKVEAPKPVPAKTEPEKAAVAAKPPAEQAAAPAKPPVIKPAAQQPPLPILGAEASAEDRTGHWEISAHYSKWSVSLLSGLFEDTLKDELAEEIQTQIVKKSGMIETGLVKLDFRHALNFDSDGSNYGFELRYYSRGRTGTFSLGLAFEKTDLSLMLNGPLTQEYSNGAVATVNASTKLVSSPFSTHVNFRWEVGSDAILIPYFTAGFGFAPLKGTLTYNFTGTFTKDDIVEPISDEKEKTLDQLSEDIDFRFPDLLVIFQLDFGLKARLYRGLYLFGEAGLWDGLVLRGGLAYRF